MAELLSQSQIDELLGLAKSGASASVLATENSVRKQRNLMGKSLKNMTFTALKR